MICKCQSRVNVRVLYSLAWFCFLCSSFVGRLECVVRQSNIQTYVPSPRMILAHRCRQAMIKRRSPEIPGTADWIRGLWKWMGTGVCCRRGCSGRPRGLGHVKVKIGIGLELLIISVYRNIPNLYRSCLHIYIYIYTYYIVYIIDVGGLSPRETKDGCVGWASKKNQL